MKKTIPVLAAVFCLMACNKVEGPSNNNTLSAVAYIAPQTKTIYTDKGAGSGMTVDWADNEEFRAYYDGSNTPVVFSKSETGNTFSAVDAPDGLTASTPFTALYGSNASLNSSGTISIDFSRQNGSLANVKEYDVMTATSELTDGVLSFAFKHKCAIIRLSVTNNGEEPADNVQLRFYYSSISSEFAEHGFIETIYYHSLTFCLSTPIFPRQTATVYCVVPAISFNSSDYDYIMSAPENVAVCNIYTPYSGITAGRVYDASVVIDGKETDPE